MKKLLSLFLLITTLVFGQTTCTSSTTWDGSNWNPITPDLTTTAIINGNYDTAVDGSINCCNLIINPTYSMVVSLGDYVNIVNDLTVNTTIPLLVRSGGSLILSSDTSISSGPVSVQRRTPNMKRYDYTYWSSCVTTQIGGALLATNWEPNYTFIFNTPTFFDIESTYFGNFIDNNPDGQDDNGDVWVNTALTDNMIAGKGYASMVNSITATGTYPRTELVTFTGELNTGIISIPLMLSANIASNVDDFNLLGNPYSSAINANDFIDVNINEISGTLYFWTHTNTLTTAYSGLAPLNFSTNDYARYTKLGGVRATFGGVTPTNVIRSGQGFLVEAETANNAIIRPSFMSIDYLNTSSGFFRTTTTPEMKIWLNFTTEQGLFSQQLIGYNEDTDLNYNKGWDSRIGNVRLASNFYSVENDVKYDIQSRGNFNVSDVVKIGYFTAVPETYTIALDSIVGIDNVWIKDNGIIHELPYTFTTDAGEFNDRFELVYVNDDLGIDVPIKDVIIVYPNPTKDMLYIDNYLGEIKIFDLLGRECYFTTYVENNTTCIYMGTMSKGAYILKTENKSFKIIFF